MVGRPRRPRRAAKPFDLEELIARIRAVLRRTGGPDGVLAVADLTLDPGGHQAVRGGVPVRLSPTELRLRHLMESADRVLSEPQILGSGSTTSAATRASWSPTSATCSGP